jgi:DNA-binding CsgD family transcriptional regulator
MQKECARGWHPDSLLRAQCGEEVTGTRAVDRDLGQPGEHLRVHGDLARLSDRQVTRYELDGERELVTLVAQGRTNAQIADQLHISVRTVGSHLDRIRDKTGCRRRVDLTRLALSAGLV